MVQRADAAEGPGQQQVDLPSPTRARHGRHAAAVAARIQHRGEEGLAVVARLAVQRDADAVEPQRRASSTIVATGSAARPSRPARARRARIATAASKPAGAGRTGRRIIADDPHGASARAASGSSPAAAGPCHAQRARGVVTAAQRHHAERRRCVSTGSMWCRCRRRRSIFPRLLRGALQRGASVRCCRIHHRHARRVRRPATSPAAPARQPGRRRRRLSSTMVGRSGGTPGSRRRAGRWAGLGIAARA